MFEKPRYKELFEPPLVLIKKHISLPMAFWNKSFLAYQSSIIGIRPKVSGQEPALHRFFELLRSRRRFYEFCCLVRGSKVFVAKATAILKQDIDALPFPEDESELDLAFWEKAIIDDVLEYMAPFVRLGQNSELLEQAAPKEQLRLYAEMFCRMLGTVYKNLKASESIHANGLICQPFYFGEALRVDWSLNDQKKLEQLIYKQEHGSLRTVRIVRLYDENVMLIVKPDRLRYWIRSTAIRDADETLLDLRRQGY